MLREQLDQATSANQCLTTDVQRMTTEWQRGREEMEMKEAEWREEEQVCQILQGLISRCLFQLGIYGNSIMRFLDHPHNLMNCCSIHKILVMI